MAKISEELCFRCGRRGATCPTLIQMARSTMHRTEAREQERPTMNLNKRPTRADLADLLSACDDDAASHVLWVGHDGDVHASPLPRGVMPNQFGERADLRFRYETFDEGNGYTGPSAAADRDFVGRLYKALVRDWKGGLVGYSDDWDAR